MVSFNMLKSNANKSELNKNRQVNMLEVQGMLKPNTCSYYTWLLAKVKKQVSTRFLSTLEW